MVALEAAGTSQHNKGFGAERASRQSPIANGAGRWPLTAPGNGGVDPISAVVGVGCIGLVLAVILAAIVASWIPPAAHGAAIAHSRIETGAPAERERARSAHAASAAHAGPMTPPRSPGKNHFTTEAQRTQRNARSRALIRDPEPETRHPL